MISKPIKRQIVLYNDFMITFILPGYSVKNKAWLEETAMGLKVEGFVRPIFWEHWTDPDAKFDKKEKASLIARHAKGDKVNIIAKSIGTLVAALIIKEIPEQINKVILNGICVNDITPKQVEFIKSQIKKLGDKVIIFQNEADPHGTYDQVKDFGKVISKPRSDHNYPYYNEFNKFLSGPDK
jgi:predicted alpha/beta hydrolase family esterase